MNDWLAIASMVFAAALFTVTAYWVVLSIRQLRKLDREHAEHESWKLGLEEGSAAHEKLERARRRWKRGRGSEA